jgi:hypothetical protein
VCHLETERSERLAIYAWIYFSKWHKSKDLDTILLLADFGHVRAVTLRGQLHYSQRFCLGLNKTLLAEMVLVKTRPPIPISLSPSYFKDGNVVGVI